MQEIEKIRRNIWLELNNYLTPLEQINIVTSILYSYYGLKGNETNYKEPNEFLLHKTLEAKRGNQISNGILYLLALRIAGYSCKSDQYSQSNLLSHISNPDIPMKIFPILIIRLNSLSILHPDRYLLTRM